MLADSFAEKCSFSIIIPLFNEEETVPLLIDTIFREVGQHPQFLELVLIDDGSRDQTVNRVLERSQQESRIRLLQHGRNRGLGAGIRTGLQAARGDLILYTDADLPFDFSLIPKLISYAGTDRVVTGCRLNRGEGLRRWILTKGYNFLIYLCFGLYMRDINFACKIVPQWLARKITLHSEGSFIDAELMLEALRHGLAVKEVPMVYQQRQLGQSTLSRPGVIVGIVQEMTQYMRRHYSTAATLQAGLRRTPLIKFSLALLVSALALVIALPWQAFVAGTTMIFLAAIALVSWICGWQAGLVNALLSYLAINHVSPVPDSGASFGGSSFSRIVLFLACVLAAQFIHVLRKRGSQPGRELKL